MFLIKGIKELISGAPILKRHERRVELIFIELYDGFWVEIDPIKVRPVPYQVSREWGRFNTLFKALLIWILLNCGLSLDYCWTVPT